MTAAHRFAVTAAVALVAVAVEAADTLKIRHVASAYKDSKDVALREPQGIACGGGLVVVADGGGGIVLFDATDKGLVPRADLVPEQSTSPLRVAIAADGDLLVLDGKTRRLARLSPAGEFRRYLDVPTAPGRTLAAPRSLAVAADGTILVLDAASGTVALLDKDGTPAGRVGLPQGGGYSDLAVARDGTVLVVDPLAARVLRAGRGDKGAAPWSPVLRTPSIEFPTSLVVSAAGRVLLLDEHAGTVVPLRGDGSAGTPALGFGWDEGQLRYPTDMCLDGSNRLFVADRDNRRVQMFQISD